MANQITDTSLRCDIRGILARHRIDMQHAQFRVTRGIVRWSGDVYYTGGLRQSVDPGVVEAFERDLVTMRGIKSLFFDFMNWRKLSTGEWLPIAPKHLKPYAPGPIVIGSAGDAS